MYLLKKITHNSQSHCG